MKKCDIKHTRQLNRQSQMEIKSIKDLFTINETDPVTYISLEYGDCGPMELKYKTKSNDTFVHVKISEEYISGDIVDSEELLICSRLTEYTSLETFVFGSCSPINIPRIPSSLKVLKLTHCYFNEDLFEMMSNNNGRIYITLCCHKSVEDANYRPVVSMKDAKKRDPVGDKSNCKLCLFSDKIQCIRCKGHLSIEPKDTSEILKFFYVLLIHGNKYMGIKHETNWCVNLKCDQHINSIDELKKIKVVCMNCKYANKMESLKLTDQTKYHDFFNLIHSHSDKTEQQIIDF